MRLFLVSSAWRNVPLISQILCCQNLVKGKIQSCKLRGCCIFWWKPIKVDRPDFLSEHALLCTMIKCEFVSHQNSTSSKITTALLIVFKMRVTTGISSVWIWSYSPEIASDIPLPSERVFLGLFTITSTYFVNALELVQPSEWDQHHHHTSFSGIPCKLLLPETGGTFVKLDLKLVSCPLSLKSLTLLKFIWNQFDSFNIVTSNSFLPIAEEKRCQS